MRLMVASWNNGGSAYNTETEETNLLYYTIEHELNGPAVATVILRDNTGTMIQKYNADANDVYIGAGRLTIEDSTATDIFYGRIIKAVPDSVNRTLVLTARDWLCQLDDEIVDYDMREDLDGAGLRQSTLHSIPDSAIYIAPAYTEEESISAVRIDGGVETNETTDANDADANDVSMYPTPEVGDSFCFGFAAGKRAGMRLNMGTAGVGDYTLQWYYSRGADAWGTITVVDGTNSFKTAGTHDVTWAPPSDWATDEVGTLADRYWIKAQLVNADVDTNPLGTEFWRLEYHAYDDAMAWANDAFNDMYLSFTAGMAGTIEIGTGPYLATPTVGVTGDGDSEALWADDNAVAVFLDNNNYSMQYDFRLYVGHNTPCDLYVNDSISSLIVTCTYQYDAGGIGAAAIVEIYDAVGATWVKLEDLTDDNTTFRRANFAVPGYYIARVVDSSGIVKVRFSVTDAAWGGNATITLDYLWVRAVVKTTGYGSHILILDTVTTNDLSVATDLEDTAATKIWEGIPYSIAKKINLHINTIVTAGDTAANPLTTNVESTTTGISVIHFEKRTRLDILKQLAEEDAVSFWVPLATSQVQWLRTTDSTSTALSDTGVRRWRSNGFDFDRVYNEYFVSGISLGAEKVEGTDSDATSIAKFNATRSNILATRAMSVADANAMAGALVDRDKDPLLSLKAEIPGLSSIRLGDYIAVTSTYLNLAAVAYTVTGWVYESNTYTTTITLEPRGTVGYVIERQSVDSVIQGMQQQRRLYTSDRYLSDLQTQVVS